GTQQRFERARDAVDLAEQQTLIAFVEIDQLARAGDPRHEDDPRKARVIHQAELGERQCADRVRVGREARIEREAHAPPRLRAKNASARSSASLELAASYACGSTARSNACPAGYV